MSGIGAYFVTVTKRLTYAVIASSDDEAKAMAEKTANGGPTEHVRFVDKETLSVVIEESFTPQKGNLR